MTSSSKVLVRTSAVRLFLSTNQPSRSLVIVNLVRPAGPLSRTLLWNTVWPRIASRGRSGRGPGTLFELSSWPRPPTCGQCSINSVTSTEVLLIAGNEIRDQKRRVGPRASLRVLLSSPIDLFAGLSLGLWVACRGSRRGEMERVRSVVVYETYYVTRSSKVVQGRRRH